jgi:hypothetical protein
MLVRRLRSREGVRIPPLPKSPFVDLLPDPSGAKIAAQILGVPELRSGWVGLGERRETLKPRSFEPPPPGALEAGLDNLRNGGER